MENDKKVWEVAKKLVTMHGNRAAEVAHDHAKQHFRKGEFPSGAVWERIKEVADVLVRDDR